MADDDSRESAKDTSKENKPVRDSTKMAAVAVVTATVFSPQLRGMLRRGAVRGVAGVLVFGDAISSFARSVGRGIQEANSSAAEATQNPASQLDDSAAAAAWEAARAAQEAAQAAQEAAEAARVAMAAEPETPKAPSGAKRSKGGGGTDANE